MAIYEVITLIDITRSNPSRTETDRILLGQQANFNTLMQTIGLRANFDWRQDPVRYMGRLPEPMTGRGAYWIWQFETERDFLFEKDGDSTFLLRQDLENIPVVAQLNNTVDIDPAAFKTQGPKINIWVNEINTFTEANN